MPNLGSTKNAARKSRLTSIPAEESLLDLSQAGTLLGMSRATLYRRSRCDASFPPLVKFGSRCTRVRVGDLLRWAAAHEAK